MFGSGNPIPTIQAIMMYRIVQQREVIQLHFNGYLIFRQRVTEMKHKVKTETVVTIQNGVSLIVNAHAISAFLVESFLKGERSIPVTIYG